MSIVASSECGVESCFLKGCSMKLPKHLEERRYDKAQALAEELFHAGPEQAFKDGYDLAVAGMHKEVEPLVEALGFVVDLGLHESACANQDDDAECWCYLSKARHALQAWQKKFGGEGE